VSGRNNKIWVEGLKSVVSGELFFIVSYGMLFTNNT
jgi:hypothetical protein